MACGSACRRHSAEITAGTGYDWLLVDGEHAPNDLRSILHQLQAASQCQRHQRPAAGGNHPPVARVPVGTPPSSSSSWTWGVQTLLVPWWTPPSRPAAGARHALCAEGVRGMGSALAARRAGRRTRSTMHGPTSRSACWCRPDGETMNNLDAIAATPGVDGVFIGPADMSASMGRPATPGTPRCRRPSTTALRASCARANAGHSGHHRIAGTPVAGGKRAVCGRGRGHHAAGQRCAGFAGALSFAKPPPQQCGHWATDTAARSPPFTTPRTTTTL